MSTRIENIKSDQRACAVCGYKITGNPLRCPRCNVRLSRF